MSMLVEYTNQIMRNAKLSEQRTGQYLFNKLPGPVAVVVGGTSFDPFHKDLSAIEISDWIDSHLIFDNGWIVGVFHGERVLWEGDRPAMINEVISQYNKE